MAGTRCCVSCAPIARCSCYLRSTTKCWWRSSMAISPAQSWWDRCGTASGLQLPHAAALEGTNRSADRDRPCSMDILSSLPTIRALTLSGLEPKRPALTERQRQRLASVSTRLQIKPRTIIYRDGDAADSIFIISDGVVIAFKELPSGKRRVAGFRFSGDVFGLAERGV